MSSPTTSPTSTPTASRPTIRCSRNISTRTRMRTISSATTAGSAMCRTAAPSATSTQGAVEQTKQSARHRDQRQRLLRRADRRRRALHPRRQPAAQQHGPARDLRRQSGAGHLRPDRVPADRPRHQRSPPTAPSRCVEGTGRPIRSAASFASSASTDAQKLLKHGANLYSAGAGGTPQADTKSTLQQGFIEKSNVNSVAEMSRMVEVMRTYSRSRTCCSSRATCTNRRSRSSPTCRPEREEN